MNTISRTIYRHDYCGCGFGEKQATQITMKMAPWEKPEERPAIPPKPPTEHFVSVQPRPVPRVRNTSVDTFSEWDQDALQARWKAMANREGHMPRAFPSAAGPAAEYKFRRMFQDRRAKILRHLFNGEDTRAALTYVLGISDGRMLRVLIEDLRDTGQITVDRHNGNTWLTITQAGRDATEFDE